MSSELSFNTPAWRGRPELIAELWTLHQPARTARCVLWNHPDGALIRIEMDGAIFVDDAADDLTALLAVAEQWRGELRRLGWHNDQRES